MGLAILLAAAVVVLGGCAQPARLANPLDIPTADADRVAKVTERVLQELRFQLEYPKVVPERIETEFLTGASWWEFWREDTVGAYQTTESSFHTIRRRVSVALKPLDTGTEIGVRVSKERMSNPGVGPMDIANSWGVHMYYKLPLIRPDELKPAGEQWIDQGRDDALEQQILDRVQRYLALGMPAK
jgi:hypothetical protein